MYVTVTQIAFLGKLGQGSRKLRVFLLYLYSFAGCYFTFSSKNYVANSTLE